MAAPLGNVLQKESYLAMIRNAEGSKLFRNLYARIGGERSDITKGGVTSCAYFVSIILHAFYLVETPHATVAGLERDLLRSGWQKTDTPHEGDIIVWEPVMQAGSMNAHVGFYIGEDKAISNDFEMRLIMRHHYTGGIKPDGSPVRVIAAIYTREFES